MFIVQEGNNGSIILGQRKWVRLAQNNADDVTKLFFDGLIIQRWISVGAVMLGEIKSKSAPVLSMDGYGDSGHYIVATIHMEKGTNKRYTVNVGLTVLFQPS